MVSHFVTRIHATFSILTFIFEAVTKLAQLHKRLHDTSGFRHFPHESAQNSCLDSSARYRAENPSASAQISVSARAGNSRNSSEKCKLSMSSTVDCTTRIAHILFYVCMYLCAHVCCGSIYTHKCMVFTLNTRSKWS